MNTSTNFNNQPLSTHHDTEIDFDSLYGQDKEFQLTELRQLFTDKSGNQIQQLLDSLTESIATEKEEVRELRSTIKRRLYSGDYDDTQYKSEAKATLADLEEVLDELDSYKSMLKQVATDQRNHHIELNDGSDMSISDLILDGETYTYSLGSAKSIFDSLETENNDGVTNESGAVIKDVNGDGKFNPDDIEAYEKEMEGSKALSQQKIFIMPKANENWSLASADSQAGIFTFKVENTTTGEFAWVTFENASTAAFIFSGGFAEGDLEAMKVWPTDLLENCYWGDDPEPFAKKLKLGSQHSNTEVTDKTASKEADTPDNETNTLNIEQLKILPGFEATYAGYDQQREAWDNADMYGAVNDMDGDGQMLKRYQSTIGSLYTALNASGSTEESVRNAWKETINSYKNHDKMGTLKTLIQSVCLGVAMNDREHYNILIGSAKDLLSDFLMSTEGKNKTPVTALLTHWNGDNQSFSLDSSNFTDLVDPSEQVNTLTSIKKLLNSANLEANGIEDQRLMLAEQLITDKSYQYDEKSKKFSSLSPKAEFQAQLNKLKSNELSEVGGVDKEMWLNWLTTFSHVAFDAKGEFVPNLGEVMLRIPVNGDEAPRDTSPAGWFKRLFTWFLPQGWIGAIAGETADRSVEQDVDQMVEQWILTGQGELAGSDLHKHTPAWAADGNPDNDYFGIYADELLSNILVIFKSTFGDSFCKKFYNQMQPVIDFLYADSDEDNEGLADNQLAAVSAYEDAIAAEKTNGLANF